MCPYNGETIEAPSSPSAQMPPDSKWLWVVRCEGHIITRGMLLIAGILTLIRRKQTIQMGKQSPQQLTWTLQVSESIV